MAKKSKKMNKDQLNIHLDAVNELKNRIERGIVIRDKDIRAFNTNKKVISKHRELLDRKDFPSLDKDLRYIEEHLAPKIKADVTVTAEPTPVPHEVTAKPQITVDESPNTDHVRMISKSPTRPTTKPEDADEMGLEGIIADFKEQAQALFASQLVFLKKMDEHESDDEEIDKLIHENGDESLKQKLNRLFSEYIVRLKDVPPHLTHKVMPIKHALAQAYLLFHLRSFEITNKHRYDKIDEFRQRLESLATVDEWATEADLIGKFNEYEQILSSCDDSKEALDENMSLYSEDLEQFAQDFPRLYGIDVGDHGLDLNQYYPNMEELKRGTSSMFDAIADKIRSTLVSQLKQFTKDTVADFPSFHAEMVKEGESIFKSLEFMSRLINKCTQVLLQDTARRALSEEEEALIQRGKDVKHECAKILLDTRTKQYQEARDEATTALHAVRATIQKLMLENAPAEEIERQMTQLQVLSTQYNEVAKLHNQELYDFSNALSNCRIDIDGTLLHPIIEAVREENKQFARQITEEVAAELAHGKTFLTMQKLGQIEASIATINARATDAESEEELSRLKQRLETPKKEIVSLNSPAPVSLEISSKITALNERMAQVLQDIEIKTIALRTPFREEREAEPLQVVIKKADIAPQPVETALTTTLSPRDVLTTEQLTTLMTEAQEIANEIITQKDSLPKTEDFKGVFDIRRGLFYLKLTYEWTTKQTTKLSADFTLLNQQIKTHGSNEQLLSAKKALEQTMDSLDDLSRCVVRAQSEALEIQFQYFNKQIVSLEKTVEDLEEKIKKTQNETDLAAKRDGITRLLHNVQASIDYYGVVPQSVRETYEDFIPRITDEALRGETTGKKNLQMSNVSPLVDKLKSQKEMLLAEQAKTPKKPVSTREEHNAVSEKRGSSAVEAEALASETNHDAECKELVASSKTKLTEALTTMEGHVRESKELASKTAFSTTEESDIQKNFLLGLDSKVQGTMNVGARIKTDLERKLASIENKKIKVSPEVQNALNDMIEECTDTQNELYDQFKKVHQVIFKTIEQIDEEQLRKTTEAQKKAQPVLAELKLFEKQLFRACHKEFTETHVEGDIHLSKEFQDLRKELERVINDKNIKSITQLKTEIDTVFETKKSVLDTAQTQATSGSLIARAITSAIHALQDFFSDLFKSPQKRAESTYMRSSVQFFVENKAGSNRRENMLNEFKTKIHGAIDSINQPPTEHKPGMKQG